MAPTREDADDVEMATASAALPHLLRGQNEETRGAASLAGLAGSPSLDRRRKEKMRLTTEKNSVASHVGCRRRRRLMSS